MENPPPGRTSWDQIGTALSTSTKSPVSRSCRSWPLAIPSMGESWHNLHHADPTCARHGVCRGQLDMTARLIWIFELFGWARRVRWPTPARVTHLIAAQPT